MRAAAALVVTCAACSPKPRTVELPIKDAPTCADLEPDHERAVAESAQALREALKHKGLMAVEMPARAVASELDAVRGQPVAAWTVFDLQGHPTIAGDTFPADRVPEPHGELMKDSDGALWHVKLAPHRRVVREEAVKACSWGCWGDPGSGVYTVLTMARHVWVLSPEQHYAGEVTVEYDAPEVVDHVLDTHCPLPQ